ncbi:hypothetical protein HELRODRAFT_162989 [Helobdella robusta]|uniref:CCHC-type domain-containing protein n=1 Tax=Helobdella robusta TaxID=6412 RepID=T1ETI1_HELRO|nr:hypothetical protein HELRODRAFT_162989 [Helobdella robusta]ESN99440.1 hypothetical protein HELRODRAFT_162989 [Helobdella robusta]
MEAYLSCSLTGEAAEVLWDLAELAYPGKQSKLAIHLTRDFLSALNDADLELKEHAGYNGRRDESSGTERQMNSLCQSLDLLRDHRVQPTVFHVRGEKVCFDCGKLGHFVSQCPQRSTPKRF